jgi:hypothetical protein
MNFAYYICTWKIKLFPSSPSPSCALSPGRQDAFEWAPIHNCRYKI